MEAPVGLGDDPTPRPAPRPARASVSPPPDARADGWSGLALKTCKGHSFVLVAAAWARQHGMLLSMQDLTNPGLAAIHSALFAARMPTLNGIELNSPQFTPAANAEWLPRLSGLQDSYYAIYEMLGAGWYAIRH